MFASVTGISAEDYTQTIIFQRYNTILCVRYLHAFLQSIVTKSFQLTDFFLCKFASCSSPLFSERCNASIVVKSTQSHLLVNRPIQIRTRHIGIVKSADYSSLQIFKTLPGLPERPNHCHLSLCIYHRRGPPYTTSINWPPSSFAGRLTFAVNSVGACELVLGWIIYTTFAVFQDLLIILIERIFIFCIPRVTSLSTRKLSRLTFDIFWKAKV